MNNSEDTRIRRKWIEARYDGVLVAMGQPLRAVFKHPTDGELFEFEEWELEKQAKVSGAYLTILPIALPNPGETTEEHQADVRFESNLVRQRLADNEVAKKSIARLSLANQYLPTGPSPCKGHSRHPFRVISGGLDDVTP